MLGPWEVTGNQTENMYRAVLCSYLECMLFLAVFLEKDSLELGEVQKKAIIMIKGNKGDDEKGHMPY